jgi:hypothetical protein
MQGEGMKSKDLFAKKPLDIQVPEREIVEELLAISLTKETVEGTLSAITAVMLPGG